ncbi:signal peptidase II [Puniceicoccales bacterium CK1056]|uniref:Lipoprotein signal peptidase n=1 Tax=Oceanipulchritudo coccoides TaxID=2706888 RepID=A0A6B2M3Y4_9BACT|nr:signal peptidase II [Oceanipulchritudo coccoides]NDV62814.1 signal peptidase II [Oceanipulchritudo coccoides]
MTTGTTDQGAPSASPKSASGYCRFWIILSLILFMDQLSKWIIVDYSGLTMGLYPPFGGVEIIPGFFNIVYSINYGAAWGMLEGFAWLLILLAILVLVLIALFRDHLELAMRAQQWCFGLISGGIIGNTIDRLFRGHVVDFLDFHLPFYRWPTFNVADSAIVIGTFWYIYLQFRSPTANKID